MLNEEKMISRLGFANKSINTYLLNIVILLFVNFFWFIKLGYKIIMGDDLGAWNFYVTHNFSEAVLFNTGANKYRPVFNLLNYILYKLFSYDMQKFLFFSIIFNFLIIICLYTFILKITKADNFLALCVSLLYITSRFSYYSILQITGILELLSLFLLILILHSVLDFFKSEKIKYAFCFISLYLLIIFVHERYIVLAPFLLLAILFTKTLRLRLKIILFGLTSIPFFLYFILKIFVFKIHAFEGTGGTQINFDLELIIRFVISGFLNLLQINAGPAYLNGINFLNVSITTNIIIFILIIIVISLLILFLKKIKMLDQERKTIQLKIFIMVSMLLFSLILSASITIRQELRWLYAPYVVFLTYLAYVFSFCLSSKTIYKFFKYFVLLLFCILVVRNDIYYRSYLPNVFFAYSEHIAESLYNETIGKYGTNITNYKVYLEKNSNLVWPINSESLFLSPYLGRDKFKLLYVDNVMDIPDISTDNIIALQLDTSKMEVKNVTNYIKYVKKKNDYNLQYDFIQNFNISGIEPKNVKVDTPTGLGAFLMDWNINNIKKLALTIVSGTKFTYSNLQIKKNNILGFSLAIPYETSDGARVKIYAIENGLSSILFDKDLNYTNYWQDFNISLKPYEGKNINIVFEVSSPSGNDIADWVTFSDLEIKMPK